MTQKLAGYDHRFLLLDPQLACGNLPAKVA